MKLKRPLTVVSKTMMSSRCLAAQSQQHRPDNNQSQQVLRTTILLSLLAQVSINTELLSKEKVSNDQPGCGMLQKASVKPALRSSGDYVGTESNCFLQACTGDEIIRQNT